VPKTKNFRCGDAVVYRLLPAAARSDELAGNASALSGSDAIAEVPPVLYVFFKNFIDRFEPT